MQENGLSTAIFVAFLLTRKHYTYILYSHFNLHKYLICIKLLYKFITGIFLFTYFSYFTTLGTGNYNSLTRVLGSILDRVFAERNTSVLIHALAGLLSKTVLDLNIVTVALLFLRSDSFFFPHHRLNDPSYCYKLHIKIFICSTITILKGSQWGGNKSWGVTLYRSDIEGAPVEELDQ